MHTRPSVHIWLRNETNPLEKRTPLVPADAALLVEKGFRVTVEASNTRIYLDQEYLAAGCTVADTAKWNEAPADALILGLKELAPSTRPLIHRHIFFAHALKNQAGADELLTRFIRGNGTLFDLEYLRNPEGERLVAFGYWAGFVGAALATIAWARQRLLPEQLPVLSPLRSFASSQLLLKKAERKIARAMAFSESLPTVLVIGAQGRSGRGAVDACKALGLNVTSWGREHTKHRGPFPEIVDYSILVNCVGLGRPTAPFMTRALLEELPRTLSVVSDVTCDVGNPCHALPFYQTLTTMQRPAQRLEINQNPLDVIALDRLPSLLPFESSSDFSGQLTPLLLKLAETNSPVWQGAKASFQDAMAMVGREALALVR